MKALSIQQPWASLIACGLKDVENRKWALKSLPVRVLLHAGARRQLIADDNMPYSWYWSIENYQKMGALPPLEKTPISAIVGVATIEACEEGNESLWASRGPGAEYQWVMKDAKMFKEPILGVKGMLGLFDVPCIDDDNLPEFADIQPPSREGKTIRLQLNDNLFRAIKSGELKSLKWNIVDRNLDVFAKENLEALPTDKLVAINNGQTMELNVSRYTITPVEDENGDPVCEEDDLGRLYEWWEATIDLE